MFAYIWPMALVILSNILYNISSKSLPKDCSPFMALIVTYLCATFLSMLGFFFFDTQKNLLSAFQKVNWTGFTLGISMVGLEIGFIFLYRAGWKINTASLVANILLAFALIVVGAVFYKEKITMQQCSGIVISIIGVFILMTAKE